MLEIIILVLFVACALLGYALYRQQAQIEPIRLKAQQAEADERKVHQQWQKTLAELTEKDAKLTKLDGLVLQLRQERAETESHTRELEQQHSITQSLISNLRGQIQTSELTSIESKAL